MSELIPTSGGIVPIPQTNLTIRPGTMDDLPFIDDLQNKHYKMVGYMWTKQLEGKIAAGRVLIAEDERKTQAGYCDAKPIILPGEENPQFENRVPKARTPKTKVPVIERSAIM